METVESMDNFVRSSQQKMEKYAGKNPQLPSKFNGVDDLVLNTENKALEFGRKLCKNLGEDFPLK